MPALPKSTQHNQGGISRISGRTPRGCDPGPPTVLELRAEDQDRGVEQTATKVRELDGAVVVVVGGWWRWRERWTTGSAAGCDLGPITSGEEEQRAPVSHAEDRTAPIPLVTPLAAGDCRRREHKHGVRNAGAGEVNPSALAMSITKKTSSIPGHSSGAALMCAHNSVSQVLNVNMKIRQHKRRYSFPHPPPVHFMSSGTTPSGGGPSATPR
jgi:hypothetical protein